MMRGKLGILRSIWLAAALACAATAIGCVHRAPRYYDAYYNDYHKWNDREIENYQQWCHDTHRDPNRDFRKLTPEEQEEYWKWRHTTGDHHHPRHIITPD